MPNNKWIVFFQTPYDRVAFRTSELDDRATLPYHKFKEFLLSNFFMKDHTKILEELDRFQTILVDGEGDYQIIKPVIDYKSVTFEELVKFNKPEDGEETTNKDNPMLERAKGIIERIWQEKKKPKKQKPKK